MFNTVSSRSSSSGGFSGIQLHSSHQHVRPPLPASSPTSPKSSSYSRYPIFRYSDHLTSFDASHFVFEDTSRNCDHTTNDNNSKQPNMKQQSRHKKGKRKTTPLLTKNYHRFHHSSSSNDSNKEFENETSHKWRMSKEGGSLESKKSEENSLFSSSNRAESECYGARDFLERFSLPRVVKIENSHDPVLLYRCFDSFTMIEAKPVSYGKKVKGNLQEHFLHFPEGYSGWFSLTNEKGDKTSITHTSILQLVREQVCSFLSMQAFTAYTTQSAEPTDSSGKLQYFKSQVRSGQLFQLRAVFQHTEKTENGERGGGGGAAGRDHRASSTKSSKLSRTSRDLTNRYAQLVNQSNQEFYVPLSTKGQFYEIHSSMKARLCFPGLLDKTGPLALDKECLYKLTHLLRRVALPVTVKLIQGPLPKGLPKDFTDTFVLEKKFQEPLLVTCSLPPPVNSIAIQHQINCFNLNNSNLRLVKCTLGFDTESRLFKSQRLQAALAFCHKNIESWYRDVRLIPKLKIQNMSDASSSSTGQTFEKTSNNQTQSLPPRQSIEAEFFSLNDNQNKHYITKEMIDKFSKPKKWYKHWKLMSGNKLNETKDGPVENTEKGKSIDRYKDMSKLIEEKFGKKSSNPVKKSASFMFTNKRIDFIDQSLNEKQQSNTTLLKCQSLDSQLYSINEITPHYIKHYSSKSNLSDLSDSFQMCLLENETNIAGKRHQDENQSLYSLNCRCSSEMSIAEKQSKFLKLKKSKPDLIPTLRKQQQNLATLENSFISDRLYAEFHVKTKIQKRSCSKLDIKNSSNVSLEEKKNSKSKLVAVQVHQQQEHQTTSLSSSKTTRSGATTISKEDVPYCHVADQVNDNKSPIRKISNPENIYAEICETKSKCICDKRTSRDNNTIIDSECCYVTLGSNGDSVTQSDSDEAVYNTLR